MALSRNVILLLFLYFIQGLPYGFQASFLPTYLYSKGISLSSIGLLKLALAPWLCKALWAPLVDRWATKHSWLLWSVGGLVITCAVTSVAVHPEDTTSLAISMFAINLCAATQDIAVDAIAVTLLNDADVATGNTAQVVGYKIGSVFGGGVIVLFIGALGWSGIFAILTVLYIEAWMFVYVSPSLRELNARMKQAANPVFDYSHINQMKWDKIDNSSVFTDSSSTASLFPEQSLRKRKVVNQYDVYKEYYKEEDCKTSDEDFPDSARTLHARLIKNAKYRAKHAQDDAMRIPECARDAQSTVCDKCNAYSCSCEASSLHKDIALDSSKTAPLLDKNESVIKTDSQVANNAANDLFSKLQRRHNITDNVEITKLEDDTNTTKREDDASENEQQTCDDVDKKADDSVPPSETVASSTVPESNTNTLPSASSWRNQLNSEEYVADDEDDSTSSNGIKVKEEKLQEPEENKEFKEEEEQPEEPEDHDPSIIGEDEEEDEEDHFILAIYQKTAEIPGTKWLLFLVLVYKLGEQGALGLLPPFLVDEGMSLNDVTFWKGLMGQGFGIIGSLLGGWLMTKLNVPVYLLLQQLCLLRLLPIGGMLLAVSIASSDLVPPYVLHYVCVALLVLLLLLGGAVTTVTFSLMMFVSRSAPLRLQATHYTLLSTVEVFGKLAFTSLVSGTAAEHLGFPAVFVGLTMLAAGVMPIFSHCPEEVMFMGCTGSMVDPDEEAEVAKLPANYIVQKDKVRKKRNIEKNQPTNTGNTEQAEVPAGKQDKPHVDGKATKRRHRDELAGGEQLGAAPQHAVRRRNKQKHSKDNMAAEGLPQAEC